MIGALSILLLGWLLVVGVWLFETVIDALADRRAEASRILSRQRRRRAW